MPRYEMTFEAPGPGRWTQDDGHIPVPMTRFLAGYFDAVAAAGITSTLTEWGDFIQMKRATVNGFSYMQETLVGVPLGSPDAPSVDHPEVRQRIERQFAVHHDKMWRGKTRQWFDEVRPKSFETNLSLASVDVESLDDDDLIRHIDTCRNNVISMFHSHMDFYGTSLLPAGLLIDVNNFEGVKAFWTELLGVEIANEFPGMVFFKPQDGTSGVTIQQVPEAKTGKNRVHPDLEVEDLGDAERRIHELGGATVKQNESGGFHWYVMADFDGNEFCISPG